MTTENVADNFAHRDSRVRQERFGKSAPDQAQVYVQPGLTTISEGFMLQEGSLIASRLVPSVPVDKAEGKYASFPRGHFFRDEMDLRADGAESPGGNGFQIDWSNSYSAKVYAYHADAGPQARANARGQVDLDKAYTQLVTNKALIKREKFFFDNFFKTGVWTTQVQGLVDASDNGPGVDLSWADSSALPLRQIKRAIRNAQELTGYRMNKATFSAALWDAFSEHPNVVNRINGGQTPGGPAEVTRQMVANWLGLKEVLVAEAVIAANPQGHASENTLSFMDTAEDAVLLTHTPDSPSIMTPSAFYFFDWVADGMVGQFGQAISRWYNQDRKAERYEIEMATDPKKVSADCGVWMYDLLAV